MDRNTDKILARARKKISPGRCFVLDLGPGEGAASRAFQADGHTVEGIGLCPASYGHTDGVIDSDYLTYPYAEGYFDAVWASHVLEHQRNLGAFIEKIYLELKPGGWLFVVVPPAKDALVGGHVNLFTPASLVYNLILGGFDCSRAEVGQVGYNIAVLVRKEAAHLPQLRSDKGDIEQLAPFFPRPVRQGSRANSVFNWPDDRPQ